MSSVQLQRLRRGFEVDQAINNTSKQFVIIRFGSEKDCKQMDDWLAGEAASIQEKAVIYKVESSSVPELVARYGLSGPTIMFFANNTVHDRMSISSDKIETQKFKEIVKRNPLIPESHSSVGEQNMNPQPKRNWWAWYIV